MARYSLDPYQHPDLNKALTWLRLRSHLTQADLAQKVQGTSLSAAYYSEIERGQITRKDKAGNMRKEAVYPSREKLEAILDALGSSITELEGILAAKPWESAPLSKARSVVNKPITQSFAALSGTSDPSYDNYEVKVRGEISQISDLYGNSLSRTDQLTILQMINDLAKKYQ